MSVSNSLTKQTEKKTFSAFLSGDAMKRKINEMVGGEKGQQFITAIISAVSTNPQLAECDNPSILAAALLGQSLNLSPSPQLGYYYLVPFNDSKRGCKVAQFQLGYKGYVQLAIRSGYYKKINVLEIKQGELISYDPLEEEIKVNLIENELEREKAETIGYYAMFELTTGFKKAMYWSKQKMESHALQYSMGYKAKKGYTFWEKNFDEMAKKTMLRQLIGKWGEMSTEFTRAFNNDNAAISMDGSYEYVDNLPEENNIEVLPAENTAEIIENTAEIATEQIPNEEDDPFVDKKSK